MMFVTSYHNAKTQLHIPTLLKQLGNEKVILKRLPKIVKRAKVIPTSTDDNLKTQRLDTVKLKVETNNNKEEIYVHESGQKMPVKISKAYCSRCNKTVDNEKFSGKSCPTCRTMLSYKCINCNLLFSTYSSLLYHLENSCQLQASSSLSNNCKIKNNKMLIKQVNPVKSNPISSDTHKISKTFEYKSLVKSTSPTASNNEISDNNILVESKNQSNTIPITNKTNNIRSNNIVIKPKSPIKSTPIPNGTDEKMNNNAIANELKSPNQTDSKQYSIFNIKSKNKIVVKSNIEFKSTIVVMSPMTSIAVENNIDKSKDNSTAVKPKIPDMFTSTVKARESIVQQPVNNSSQIDESNISNSSTSDIDSLKDLDNSLKAGLNKAKYSVITIKPKSEAVRKLCIPCKSKIFVHKLKKCTKCLQSLTTQCMKCGKLYSSLKMASYHLEICNPVVKLSCKKCEYTTTERKHLRAHIKRKCSFVVENTLGDAKNMNICKLCKQAFTNAERLKQHQRYCAPLKCDYCSYKTKYKSSLTIHLKTHIENKKNLDGSQAYHRAPTNYLIKNNTELLTKIKEYCLKCDNTEDFDITVKRVSCKKCKSMIKWKCKPCDKLYNSIPSIKEHVKTSHIEEKNPTKCVNCQRDFTNYLKMRRHMRTCARHPAIKCDHCDFTTLHAHLMSQHHSENHPNLNTEIFK